MDGATRLNGWKRARLALLAFLLLLTTLLGARAACGLENSRNSLLAEIVLGLAAVGCCATDARARGRAVPHILQLVMFFTWPVACPVYVVASRRWLGLVIAGLLVVGYVVAFYAGVAAVAFALGGR